MPSFVDFQAVTDMSPLWRNASGTDEKWAQVFVTTTPTWAWDAYPFTTEKTSMLTAIGEASDLKVPPSIKNWQLTTLCMCPNPSRFWDTWKSLELVEANGKASPMPRLQWKHGEFHQLCSTFWLKTRPTTVSRERYFEPKSSHATFLCWHCRHQHYSAWRGSYNQLCQHNKQQGLWSLCQHHQRPCCTWTQHSDQ